MILPAWALNPGLVRHGNQVARTATLSIAPPGQAQLFLSDVHVLKIGEKNW